MGSRQREYDVVMQQLRDDPGNEQAWESLAVWGDMMQSEGDPRGEVVALSSAVRQACRHLPDSLKKVRALRRALDAHVDSHAPTLLGSATQFRTGRRTLNIEWLGYNAETAFLDARYHGSHLGIELPTLTEQIEALLTSVALPGLRRLRIRVRKVSEVAIVLGKLAELKHYLPPLEELSIGRQLRPDRILSDSRALDRARPGMWLEQLDFGVPALQSFIERCPRLHLLALFDYVVPPVTHENLANRAKNQPMWSVIGRMLWSENSETRDTALAYIANLGASAERFFPSFEILLSPQFEDRLLPVIQCASALGEHAGALVPALLAVCGRKGPYRRPYRRLAQKKRVYSEPTRQAARAAARRIMHARRARGRTNRAS